MHCNLQVVINASDSADMKFKDQLENEIQIVKDQPASAMSSATARYTQKPDLLGKTLLGQRGCFASV